MDQDSEPRNIGLKMSQARGDQLRNALGAVGLQRSGDAGLPERELAVMALDRARKAGKLVDLDSALTVVLSAA